MRQAIYNVIKQSDDSSRFNKLYDYFICAVAFMSIIPLMFKREYYLFDVMDTITVYILFADYVFRWMTFDKKIKKGNMSFLLYPFTPYALIDLLSLLPSLGMVNQSFRVLRMLRIFKILRYSKSFNYILHAFEKEKNTLYSVLVLALGYIFVSALIMFSYEPDTFSDFFAALYWATTALTTVGYGDVYPKTDIGRLISMISSLFGIAVIALPAGIITASFVDEIDAEKAAAASSREAAKSAEDKDGSVIDRIIEKRTEADKDE